MFYKDMQQIPTIIICQITPPSVKIFILQGHGMKFYNYSISDYIPGQNLYFKRTWDEVLQPFHGQTYPSLWNLPEE